jgi:hypothetical protein
MATVGGALRQRAAVLRYRATASGANTAMITSDQTTAPHTLSPAGAPSHSARIASTVTVNGLTSANHCSAEGIDSTGTKADEMKVSGKTAMKPTEFADSGEETSSPSSAKTHENA